MSFIFDKPTLTAFDPVTGERIGYSSRRHEISGVSELIYTVGDLSFEFFTVPILKNIRTKTPDGEKEVQRQVASYIDLSSLRSELDRALGRIDRPPLTEVEYSQFLSTIKEGVFAQTTWGGRMLEQSPDYRVDFVESRVREAVNRVLREGEYRMRGS